MRSWWQRLVRPSVLRRLVLAQMVLLVQLWGAVLLWTSSTNGRPESSAGVLQGGLVIVPIVISAMLLVIPAWLAAR